MACTYHEFGSVALVAVKTLSGHFMRFTHFKFSPHTGQNSNPFVHKSELQLVQVSITLIISGKGIIADSPSLK